MLKSLLEWLIFWRMDSHAAGMVITPAALPIAGQEKQMLMLALMMALMSIHGLQLVLWRVNAASTLPGACGLRGGDSSSGSIPAKSNPEESQD